jgi:hypothetical protein
MLMKLLSSRIGHQLGGMSSQNAREQPFAILSKQPMHSRIQNIRIILTALALTTVGAGFMGIYGSVTQMPTSQDDPIFGAFTAGLLLSMLLAAGGGCLLVQAAKYRG